MANFTYTPPLSSKINKMFVSSVLKCFQNWFCILGMSLCALELKYTFSMIRVFFYCDVLFLDICGLTVPKENGKSLWLKTCQKGKSRGQCGKVWRKKSGESVFPYKIKHLNNEKKSVEMLEVSWLPAMWNS